MQIELTLWVANRKGLRKYSRDENQIKIKKMKLYDNAFNCGLLK